MTLSVIFRRTKSGQIIAIFPTIPADETAPETVCAAFTLLGGKCFVDLEMIKKTTPAKYSEYLPLLQPMADAGYSDIDVAYRLSNRLNEQRLNGALAVDSEDENIFYDPNKELPKQTPAVHAKPSSNLKRGVFGRNRAA